MRRYRHFHRRRASLNGRRVASTPIAAGDRPMRRKQRSRVTGRYNSRQSREWRVEEFNSSLPTGEMTEYKPQQLDRKWQARWASDRVFEATEDPSRPKF